MFFKKKPPQKQWVDADMNQYFINVNCMVLSSRGTDFV